MKQRILFSIILIKILNWVFKFQVTLLKKRATRGVIFTPTGWRFGQHISAGQTRSSKTRPQKNAFKKFARFLDLIGRLTPLMNPNTARSTSCPIQSRLTTKEMFRRWINLGIVSRIPVPVFWVARVDICRPSWPLNLLNGSRYFWKGAKHKGFFKMTSCDSEDGVIASGFFRHPNPVHPLSQSDALSSCILLFKWFFSAFLRDSSL